MRDLVYLTAGELASAIRTREVSSTEVVEAFLGRIAERNPSINALVTVDEVGAREAAARADEALSRGGRPGPLHGVPVTFKDVFETAGLRTTAGHRPLAGHVPGKDATVVARLRASGAIVLGKTNLPDLAMDTQCANTLFGTTRNPWDPERTPGGSSGGEAAALAAGMTPLGVGSDLGGSVRIPAHFCGVFSLKPTEGRIPMTGHVPPLPGTMNWLRHLAVAGPMARSVADLRQALSILAGPDGKDPSALPIPLAATPGRALKDCRIAWTDDLGGLPVSADTREALGRVADGLAAAGCRVERAHPPDFDWDAIWRTYGGLVGVLLAAQVPFPLRAVLRSLGGLIFRKDPVTRAGSRRVTAGMKSYFSLLEQRDRWTRSLEGFLSGVDAWLLPVSSAPAFPHRKPGRINASLEVDGIAVPGHLATLGMTCPFNLTGSPVVVLPMGRSREGLPMGCQLVGRRWEDMALLDVAEALSEVTGPFVPPPQRC